MASRIEDKTKRKFARYYIECGFSAVMAYKKTRPWVTHKTARVQGAKLAKDKEVQKFIEDYQNKESILTEINFKNNANKLKSVIEFVEWTLAKLVDDNSDNRLMYSKASSMMMTGASTIIKAIAELNKMHGFNKINLEVDKKIDDNALNNLSENELRSLIELQSKVSSS